MTRPPMDEHPRPSPAVAAAFTQLSDGATLDLGTLDPVLRPWLESRAAEAVADSTLAALVAQQVLVDLGSRVASDFPSTSALEQWLGIRTVQTVGLFTGYTAPDVMPLAVASPQPSWQFSFLAIPAFLHLPKLSSLGWLVGFTGATAAVTAAAAISVTAMLPSGLGVVPPLTAPESVPPPITSILALPTSPPTTPTASAPVPAPTGRSTPAPSNQSTSTTAKLVKKAGSAPTGAHTQAPTPPVTPTPPPTPPPPTPTPSPHCGDPGHSGDHRHRCQPCGHCHDRDDQDSDDCPVTPQEPGSSSTGSPAVAWVPSLEESTPAVSQ